MCKLFVLGRKTSYLKLLILERERDFHIIDNLSRAVHALPMRILTSVDEILQPRYLNWSSDFRGLLFNEVTPSCLKHRNSILSELT